MDNADLIEVYTDMSGASAAAAEWRDSQRVRRCRIVKRTVRAFGAATTVYVVCTWYTQAAKVHGWNQ